MAGYIYNYRSAPFTESGHRIDKFCRICHDVYSLYSMGNKGITEYVNTELPKNCIRCKTGVDKCGIGGVKQPGRGSHKPEMKILSSRMFGIPYNLYRTNYYQMENLTNIRQFLICIILLSVNLSALAQSEMQDSTFRRHFIGTSTFMLLNLGSNSGDFYQLDFGYWLTRKDAIILTAKTWKYLAPLGIPYGSALGAKEMEYPGYVRAFGIGADYQRMLWKRLFSIVQVQPFFVSYNNQNKTKIQNGFQLFLALRLGYHIDLFKNRFYLEPSVAFNYWPIYTNLPPSFAAKENKWHNYFLFEPGLNFGIKF